MLNRDGPCFVLQSLIMILTKCAPAGKQNYIMGLRMGKTQKGFTLIELMIVIAVIGVLSVLALAAYQEYQIRAQVSEALGLAAGLKNTVAEYHSNHGSFPTDNGQAGAPQPLSINGRYVTRVTIVNGAIQAALGKDIHAKVWGQVIELSPSFVGGSFDWDCDTAGTTVQQKFLPSACRY